MSPDAAPRDEAAAPAAATQSETAHAETDESAAAFSPDQGGDAACWLGRVCDNCGALIEGSRGVPCWRCKTPWQPA